MMTIEQWNAKQVRDYKPPKPIAYKPRPPTKVGAGCNCGKPLFHDYGVVYGWGPFSLGVICFRCRQRGYIKEGWPGPRKIVLI